MKISLPIDDFLSSIQLSIKNKQNLIISAAPGAGKTTRVPPATMAITTKKTLLLQPRRIAARASAERIAEENAWTLGEQVGYRVRFEDRTSTSTRLIVVTEALLMRELQKDPSLAEYGLIILDEFHERNLYTDAGLAAIRELQLLHRPDLKMIVMSATINSDPLLKYLEPAEVIQVPGRTFPVEIHYDSHSQLLQTNSVFIERVVNKIIEVQMAKLNSLHHTLVFLPGLSEIQRVQRGLPNHHQWKKLKINIFYLHGSLSLKEQHAVLHSSSSSHSKLILTTNVAETSLTIDGVDTVIDSGLARDLQWDQRRLFPWLKTTRISKASAEQRKGRAGRQFPGCCFRLWTKLDDQSMTPFSPPDIINQDLTDLVLMLISLGISDPKNFSWYENPNPLHLERAILSLHQWDIIETPEPPLKLTSKGKRIQNIPLSPRLAALIDTGRQKQQEELALSMAVLLYERDPWAKENMEALWAEAQDSDLLPRLQALMKNSDTISNTQLEFHVQKQTLRQLQRILSMTSNKKSLELLVKSPSALMESITNLLLSCYSDRIARRRRPGENTALSVGQKGVELSQQSLVKQSEFFFCLQGHANESNGNAIVDLAHPLSKKILLETFPNEITIKKDVQYFTEKSCWMTLEQKYFRDLPIEDPNLKPLIINKENLLFIVQHSFDTWKKTLPHLIQWQQRLQLAQKLWPEEPWPNLAIWEKETLEMACMGEEQLSVVQEKNWPELFSYSLNPHQKKLLYQELPASITTPKGKIFTLEYESSGVVNLALKIQDAFGWKETPKIAQGKIKLRIFLLGPHMRPLQTTDDLASFWRGAYQEMRPSLKARYPKHSWPEDPENL